MATVVFAWELGGGLGHLMQMLPLAEGLARRGHRVFVALRDLAAAASLFDRKGLCFLPAPHKEGAGPLHCRRTLGFVHVLANVGWHADAPLGALAGAWRNLFVAVRPNLVIFDHSPTALLASRGLPMKRVLIGSGFCCPPDTFPLPALANGVDLKRLRDDERRVLDRANRLLASWRQRPLERLGQLYSGADENFLTALPELEQYPGRIGGRYWGPMIGAAGGAAPRWPEGHGPRVLAYLKPFRVLADLLGILREKGCPAVAYVTGLDPTARRQFESPTMRIEARPLDIARAVRECDLAILNAGQGSTAQVLLAGKPVLQFPLVQEQILTADATVRLGAGERAAANDAQSARAKLDEIMSNRERYATAARSFAARHADFDPRRQVDRMVERVEQLFEGAGLGQENRRQKRVPAGVFCN